MLNLKSITNDAIEELKQERDEGRIEKDDYSDRIHEIADSAIPIYYLEVIEVAQNEIEIALDIPETGPAFGVPTPMNLMMSNIYEHVSNELHIALQQREEE